MTSAECGAFLSLSDVRALTRPVAGAHIAWRCRCRYHRRRFCTMQQSTAYCCTTNRPTHSELPLSSVHILCPFQQVRSAGAL
jgi:hypothetical protein